MFSFLKILILEGILDFEFSFLYIDDTVFIASRLFVTAYKHVIMLPILK